MSQRDQEASYELEMVISQSGKVLGYQALLFKGEEILMAEEASSIPPESSDSFPVNLTDHDTPGDNEPNF